LLKLKNILLEGMSSVLFHFTNIPNLVNILKENKFHTTAAFASDNEQPIQQGYLFYVSTTRIRSTGYNMARMMNACIVLDGNKLKAKYKGVPVDYWQQISYYGKTKKYNQRDYINALKQLEQEDRILLNSPTIENALSYIKEIDLLLYTEDEFNYKSIKDIIEICNENKIPLFIYNRKDYFRYNVKSRAINISKAISNGNTDYIYIDPNNYSVFLDNYDTELIGILAMLSIDSPSNYNKIKNFFKDYGSFLDSIDRKKEVVDYDYKHMPSVSMKHSYELLRSYIFDISNHPSPVARFVLKMLVDDLRKFKATSFKQYFERKFKITLKD